MIHQLLAYPLGYLSLLAEALLPVYILRKRQVRGLWWLAAYALILACADGVRAGVVYSFGISSIQYAYTYWVTDFAISIANFVLISILFRRACHGRSGLWKHLRLMLAASFVLVVAVSSLIFFHNYGRLFTRFIIEFNQNLYFTSLVLVTLVYLMLMQIKSEDEELILIVSGLGINFAGPAALLAFSRVTSLAVLHGAIAGAFIPVCNLLMLGIWYYTVGQPSRARVLGSAPADLKVGATAKAT